MFTGIVEALGRVEAREASGGDQRLSIDAGTLDLGKVRTGDSLAVNGVCLTVVALDGNRFAADVSLETLQKTSLGDLGIGSQVNLESALTPTSALGGHWVSGHVDGLAKLAEIRPDARSHRYWFVVDPALQHYIAAKGSVTLDGVSLTVNGVDGNRFDVNIVPHTRSHTIFGNYRPGVRINLEVDIVARYLERLLEGRAEDRGEAGKNLRESLIKSGFMEPDRRG